MCEFVLISGVACDNFSCFGFGSTSFTFVFGEFENGHNDSGGPEFAKCFKNELFVYDDKIFVGKWGISSGVIFEIS